MTDNDEVEQYARLLNETNPLYQCVVERARVYSEKYDLIKAVRDVVAYSRAIRHGKARQAIGEKDDFLLALDRAEHMLWKYDVTCERKGCHQPTLSDDERYCEMHR